MLQRGCFESLVVGSSFEPSFVGVVASSRIEKKFAAS